MSNVKFLYVRNLYKNRDVTIVSDIVDENGKTYIRCGWAFRSKHDQFIKKIGREIALERMNSMAEGYSAKFEIDVQEIKFYKIASKILNIILEKETTPRIYVDDLNDDLYYFSSCAFNGKPSWNTVHF